MKNKSLTLTLTLTLTPLIIATLFFIHHKKNATAPIAIPPTPVRISHPLQKSIALTEKTTAYLIADKSTSITPQASGYIRTINFKEGQSVQAGETLFVLDKQTQQDALSSAQANAKLSQLQYERDKDLLKKGYITHNVYYTAKVTNQQNQAALQTAQTNFSQRTITAPFSGTVGAIEVSIGDYVNPGKAMTTLVDNKHLRAEYTLSVKYLSDLQPNQPVLIQSSTGQTKINATVTYIAPAVDQATQTIAVHASINNAAGLFKPGEYVTVTQNLGEQKNALLVPEQSVMASIDGYSVFTVQNNKAVRTPVKIGDRVDGNVVITSGLKTTDQVITVGENEVKNGQPVVIKKASI